MPGDLTVTGKIGKNMAQKIKRLVHRPYTGIGTKITRTIIYHLTCDCNFGKGSGKMHFDIGITLIVLQPHIEPRSVFLYQIHFQNKRFQLRTNHNPFQIGNMRNQFARFAVHIFTILKIGSHPVAQVNGFTHVNHFAGSIMHNITTRLLRQCG